MDRRGGAGALAVPAWPSMARPGARARSGEGVSESAIFRVVRQSVKYAFKLACLTVADTSTGLYNDVFQGVFSPTYSLHVLCADLFLKLPPVWRARLGT